jgi:FKBP-type peptidyl-prolyl cis-trans isomerase FkpA
MLRTFMTALACLTLVACEGGDVMKDIDRKIAARTKAAEERGEEMRIFLEQKDTTATTTPSGLQYKPAKTVATDLPKPSPVDRVLVNYEGRLPNGQIFDSSYQRGQPIDFVLNQVIPGWTEGVGLMKPGEAYLFYLPPSIAYGPMGSPPDIPPDTPLLFKVELLQFERPDGTVVKAK